MITSRLWFGPRRFGWGWTPVTWEGWALTIVAVIAVGAIGYFFGHSPLGIAAMLLCLAVFCVIVVLTGGRPGGPGLH